MEEVLDLDAAPDDPRYPQVCVDESPVQLTRETRRPRPARPGQPERYDCDDTREGTAKLFRFVPPLQGWRQVNLTQQRTQQDFAQQLRLLVEVYFPAAERIRLVVDHLHTQTPAALYGVFPPAEARRLTRQLACHDTPKHGSWLTRAECEVAVLAGQWLERRIPNLDTLPEENAAWQCQRHQHQANIHWQFSTAVARVKLKRLYPPVELSEDPVGPEASEPAKTCASTH